jgi:hypothetical protein
MRRNIDRGREGCTADYDSDYDNDNDSSKAKVSLMITPDLRGRRRG